MASNKFKVSKRINKGFKKQSLVYFEAFPCFLHPFLVWFKAFFVYVEAFACLLAARGEPSTMVPAGEDS